MEISLALPEKAVTDAAHIAMGRSTGWEYKFMMKDEVVDQVREVREQNAAKFNYDLKAIVADARKRQKNSAHQVVSFAPRRKKSK